jgi:hypothetical protein
VDGRDYETVAASAAIRRPTGRCQAPSAKTAQIRAAGRLGC